MLNGKVSIVDLGSVQFDGLLASEASEDGEDQFFVSVSQAAELFSVRQITPELDYWKVQPKSATWLIFDKFQNCAGIWKDGKFTANPNICNPKGH